MLRSENLKYTGPMETAKDEVLKLTFNESHCLRTGIKNALNDFKRVAELEYDFNDGMPVKITEKHLQWAKVFIERNKGEANLETNAGSSILNAHSQISVGQFLLDCHVLALQEPHAFHIQLDSKRKPLIQALFGNCSSETVLGSPADEPESSGQNSLCTQIIFDSADVASAIDELIISLSDRTRPVWRIQSVYVQESLKNVIYDSLTAERLSANSVLGVAAIDGQVQKNEDLAKRFGGNYLKSNDGLIHLLLNVPLKYLQTEMGASIRRIPVAVNFFRTTKELIQLLKEDLGQSKQNLASIWTENVGLLYETVANINAEIIWNNSIGVFDPIMPSLNKELDSHVARYEKNVFKLSRFYSF